MDKCIACGVCTEKCPKKVDDPYNENMVKRKAIYVEYPQAVPLKYAIDPEICLYLTKGKCGTCAKKCPAGAINFDDKEEKVTISVGSVILCPGFTPFDPSKFDNYKYIEFPNVVTSMEYERILSSTGPFQGHLVRVSDHEEPKKIAWLQCVGSRDMNKCDHPYCSSVCCMYAIKEAVISKEHATDELDAAIFFMDMRTNGKDFERYYDRAREEHGVRFIRSRIHTIVEDPETHDLILEYVDEKGGKKVETFNMVVLSVGMESSKELVEFSDRLGIELNEDNFARTEIFNPVESSRKGVYVCGAFQEPKDIPYSVMEASAAACEAQTRLSDARNTLVKTKTYPEEKDISAEEPRIGVFVCKCGTNIAGTVDVPAVAEYVRSLPGVVYVEENLFTCSQDTQDKMTEIIKKEGLNRVVVAACTPKTHEPLFQETLRNAGLNQYLFEMANIRNQCSWIHPQEKEKATEKAKELVHMAVAKVGLLQPLSQPRIPVNNTALVIGGGISGMMSALGLADQGFRAHLVEQSNELGGNALRLYETPKGDKIADRVKEVVKRVENNPLIDVYTNTTISQSTGFVGNFETDISQNGNDLHLKHGAVVVAVGAQEYKPDEYLYGEDDRIFTHLDFDQALSSGDERVDKAKTAVFIQCVGSREPERPYCSKICCTHSVTSALKLKEKNPEMDIYILYRDMRTYGRREELYAEARKKGVIFIRYDRERKPKVVKDGQDIAVTINDLILDRDLEIRPDLLVLASAIVPRDNSVISKMLKLSLNDDGFFTEAHAKLRPVEFTTDGVFLAGLAHYPKPIEESISQAKAAAARAAVTLSKEEITVEGIVSQVDVSLCRGCGLCVPLCPYGALEVRDTEQGKKVHVTEVLCKGCGVCAATCYQHALSIKSYTDSQLEAQVDALLG